MEDSINYIIDSYAWVEYFIGSKKGEVLMGLFNDKNNHFFTVECCLAEIRLWCLKNNKDFNEFYKIIMANSDIVNLDEIDWIKAGEEQFKQKKLQKDFGLIDSILIVKQEQYNYMIISGDKHFKSLKNVLFI